MKKENFMILLTILTAIPILSLCFYTYLNNTPFTYGLLIGCGIEYLAVAFTFLVEIFTD